MTYSVAWATITGKVFVDREDMADWLREKYPELKAKETDEDDIFCFCDRAQEEEAFKELAQKRIYEEMCATDDPFKLEDTEINLSTFR